MSAAFTYVMRAARLEWGLLSRLWLVVLSVAIVGGSLTACAIRLAPSYDALIVQGLNKSDEQAMTIFASVSNGTSSASFAEREQSYNELIGSLDATRLLAEARANPEPPNLQLAKLLGAKRSGSASGSLEAPTPAILKTVTSGVTKMRDRDRNRGLSPSLVAGFKEVFEISMDQALTYEKALQR